MLWHFWHGADSPRVAVCLPVVSTGESEACVVRLCPVVVTWQISKPRIVLPCLIKSHKRCSADIYLFFLNTDVICSTRAYSFFPFLPLYTPHLPKRTKKASNQPWYFIVHAVEISFLSFNEPVYVRISHKTINYRLTSFVRYIINQKLFRWS